MPVWGKAGGWVWESGMGEWVSAFYLKDSLGLDGSGAHQSKEPPILSGSLRVQIRQRHSLPSPAGKHPQTARANRESEARLRERLTPLLTI